MSDEIKLYFRCDLTDCCFNSHDNLRFDELGEPVGLAYCCAPSSEEVDREEGQGVPDHCPCFWDDDLREKLPVEGGLFE